jgi:hypothetical protein
VACLGQVWDNGDVIKRHPLWTEFEKRELSRQLSLEERLRIGAAMYEHALGCGAFPRKNQLDGFEHVVERTRKIHALRVAPRENKP